MDKGVFKDVMVAHDLPVADWIVVTRHQVQEEMADVLSRSESVGPYPLFIKPANLGSSVGISKCHSRSDLVEGLMDAARYDRRILVERGINAREIEVSVLGNDNPIASIPGEVIPSDEFYSYRAKYVDDRSELIIPAPLPEETIDRIRSLAIKAYQVIDCAGMARVDFFVDKLQGDVYISEINTIPGFTRISMYPKLWQASGIPYPDLIDRLVALALERKGDRERTERRFGG
jgi:D-alanine-D-alanine ligase